MGVGGGWGEATAARKMLVFRHPSAKISPQGQPQRRSSERGYRRLVGPKLDYPYFDAASPGPIDSIV